MEWTEWSTFAVLTELAVRGRENNKISEILAKGTDCCGVSYEAEVMSAWRGKNTHVEAGPLRLTAFRQIKNRGWEDISESGYGNRHRAARSTARSRVRCVEHRGLLGGRPGETGNTHLWSTDVPGARRSASLTLLRERRKVAMRRMKGSYQV